MDSRMRGEGMVLAPWRWRVPHAPLACGEAVTRAAS
jgi:hypothetical protein